MLHLEKKRHMCQCVCHYEGTLKQFTDTFHTHAKNNINSLTNSERQNPAKEAQASFCPSNPIHTTERHNKMKESPRQANSTQMGSSLAVLLPLLSLTTSLSFFCHIPSTVRERLF